MSNSELERLIAAWLDGRIDAGDSQALQQQLRESSEARATFQKFAQLDAALREAADAEIFGSLSSADGPPLTAEKSKENRAQPGKITLLRLLLSVSMVVIIALSIGLFYQRASSQRRIAEIKEVTQRPAAERPIARITGLSGALIWTGDRGQFVRDVQVGTELTGGTIEGMAPDSWFELEFNDGTTVMISGNSMLTFADLGQKELRLKEGRFSANVVPQPPGKPMLIHTQSARLEVLGTQFDVEAGMTSTVLNVSEGKVRVTRLSDGSEVEVPAQHRVVAEVDREMVPERVPDSVHDWKSQLDHGPEDVYGKWRPAADGRPASIRAIPFVPQENPAVTLYLLGLPVFRSDSSPVVVRPDSRFVVRGRLKTKADVYFGIRMAHANGEFAGKFRAREPASKFADDSRFEVVFELSDFTLDPCVRDRQDALPAKPDALILTGVWSFTYTDGPSGLELTEVELIPPADQTNEARRP